MKQFRINIYIFDTLSSSIWNEYLDYRFLAYCKVYADNDCYFEVEFRTI